MKWYEGITQYQWLVLLIASLGWVFDVFEGQVFVASMNTSAGFGIVFVATWVADSITKLRGFVPLATWDAVIF